MLHLKLLKFTFPPQDQAIPHSTCSPKEVLSIFFHFKSMRILKFKAYVFKLWNRSKCLEKARKLDLLFLTCQCRNRELYRKVYRLLPLLKAEFIGKLV